MSTLIAPNIDVSGEDLVQLRYAMQCSQKDFAQKLAISRSYLSKLEKGQYEVSPKVANRYRLLYQNNPDQQKSSNARSIPVRSMAQAGAGIDYDELPLSWQETVATNCPDEQAFAVEINGDSMEPKFYKGDIVVLMPSQKPCNNTLVVARLANEGVVFKVFSSRGNEITLTSYNQIHRPIIVDESSVHWVFPVWQVIRNVGNRSL